jgi:hypothetical protein
MEESSIYLYEYVNMHVSILIVFHVFMGLYACFLCITIEECVLRKWAYSAYK